MRTGYGMVSDVPPIASPSFPPPARATAYLTALAVRRYTSASMSTPSRSSTQTLEKTSSLEKVSSLEKGELEEAPRVFELPPKAHGHYLRNLRHQVLTLYRKLFGIVFIVNTIVFIISFSTNHHTSEHLGLILIANIFVSILMRQEYVVNALFTMFCAVPSSYVYLFLCHVHMLTSCL